MAATTAPSATQDVSPAPSMSVSEGYELHQRLRTKAVRQLRRKSYRQAIETLFDGAVVLLKNDQQGSGSDLALYLIEVYEQAGVEVDQVSRSRVTQLIALTSPEGSWRKKLIHAAISWSIEFGTSPAGDPALQLYIGELLYKEKAFDLAEPHLLSSGSRDGARILAQMMVEWLGEHRGREVEEAGRYALRGMLPYLLNKNIHLARVFLTSYLSQLIPSHSSLLIPSDPAHPNPAVLSASPTPASGTGEHALWMTTNPALNFAQLALETCQRSASVGADLDVDAVGTAEEARKREREVREAWRVLVRRYEGTGGVMREEAVTEALASLGQIYFNIRPLQPQGGNILQDLMAGLFGGAPGGAGAGAGGGAEREPVAGRGLRRLKEARAAREGGGAGVTPPGGGLD